MLLIMSWEPGDILWMIDGRLKTAHHLSIAPEGTGTCSS